MIARVRPEGSDSRGHCWSPRRLQRLQTSMGADEDAKCQ